MNVWFLAAGLLSLFVCWVHVVMGGKDIARPLLDSADLKPIAKYTNYYCWHLVTIMIAGLGAMFLLSAYWPEAYILAGAGAVFAGLFSLWNIALYLWKREKLRHWYDLPQWVLFAPVAILGTIGWMYG